MGRVRYSEKYLREENAPNDYALPKQPVTAEEGILDIRSILAYIPYNENNYATRIVRLEGKKEIIIENLGGSYIEKSKLTGELYDDSKYLRRGYAYNEEIQCHVSPGPM